MTTPSALGTIATALRQHDPDRFFTALFAPEAKREALFALYAFNHELARAREAVSEPHLALIRLHWWREVIQGMAKRHPVAEAIVAALSDGTIDAADLLALIDAREIEADRAIASLPAWRAYVLGTAGGLAVAAGQLLGASEPEGLRSLGAAYGVVGILRAVPALARHGRCLLPEDVLGAHGLSPEAVVSGADPTGAMAELARMGRDFLRPIVLPRASVAAALPAVLAKRDLRRLPMASGPRGLGDRLAVTWAGLTGRIG
ncbi:MAG: phytoene synthase [Acetobacteraceae bacterium]|nr:phytoene synthase [Acetobacteraceae bacterium]MSP30419.1 phytoene synthase [Acetobacteraceae bacterium]